MIDKVPNSSKFWCYIGKIGAWCGDSISFIAAIFGTLISSIPIPNGGSTWAINLIYMGIFIYLLARSYHYYRKGRNK